MSDTFHVYPSQEQIKNGNAIASILFDLQLASLDKDFKIPENTKFNQLIQEYLCGEIDTVTAIFMAMNEGTYA